MDKKIAVAGTGYVGLSIATLLAQHNHVTAVDIIPEKVELINNRKSPIWEAGTLSSARSSCGNQKPCTITCILQELLFPQMGANG